MRTFVVVLLAFVALVLGGVQLASMSLYGDLARRPAVPAFIGPRLGIALARPLARAAAPAPLRAAYARALLHRGDLAATEAIVATLPDDPDTADLRGQIAEAHGNRAVAVAAFAQAFDFERAQKLIDAAEAAGDVTSALQLERGLADALVGAGDDQVRAVALWRLGQMTQQEATRDVPHAVELEHQSLALFEEALRIAPNEETYLLAAGTQALTIGDKAAAARYYRRALESVPDSADARAGLARATL